MCAKEPLAIRLHPCVHDHESIVERTTRILARHDSDRMDDRCVAMNSHGCLFVFDRGVMLRTGPKFAEVLVLAFNDSGGVGVDQGIVEQRCYTIKIASDYRGCPVPFSLQDLIFNTFAEEDGRR
jgi:hypothetical protein